MASHNEVSKSPTTLLYHDLGDNQMRLMHLHPSREFDAPICATLHTSNFSDEPVYKALSYAWGNPHLTSNITVNGKDFPATINLVSALRHLREEQAGKVLWIDAVCINQLNVEERNRQVQMMARIYKSAEEVVAWLGESEDDSDEAMKLLDRWGKVLAPMIVHCQTDLFLLFEDTEKIKALIDTIEDPFAGKAWSALPSLYKRPYWRRLWIVQEFVLARNIMVVCGCQALRAEYLIADCFFATARNMFPGLDSIYGSETRILLDIPQPLKEERSLIYSLQSWRTYVGEHRNLSEAGHLFYLLSDVSRRDCTDPRDRIFALAGFCSADTPQIVVNYSLDTNEASEAFARGCLTQSHTQVLCYAGIGLRERQPNAPRVASWVPDWRPMTGSWEAWALGHSRLNHIHYLAGGHSQGACRVHERRGFPTTITLSGHVVDTTVDVLQGWSDWENPHDRRWRALLFKEECRTKYEDGMPTLQAYFRTLFADMDLGLCVQRMPCTFKELDGGRNLECLTIGGSVVNFLTQYRLRERSTISEANRGAFPAATGADEIIRLSAIKHFFSEGEEPSQNSWNQWVQNARLQTEMFRQVISGRATGRSFFTTSSGYMGTGPPYARPGDKVCVFQGLNVPFLLRPNGDGYLLVGEAFVLGLMNGEYNGGFEEIEIH